MKRGRLLAGSVLLAIGAFAVAGTKLFFPYHRWVALGLFVLAWGPFFFAYRHRASAVAEQRRRAAGLLRSHRGKLAWAGALLAIGYAGVVLFPADESGLGELSADELRESLRADLQVLVTLDQNIVTALDGLVDDPLFTDRAGNGQLDSGQRARLRSLWARYLEAALELEVIQVRYRTFFQVSPLREPELHAGAFCLAYAAFVAEYRAAFRIVALVDGRPGWEKALNEPGSDVGLPPKSFLNFRREMTSAENLLRLAAGRSYYPLVRGRIRGHDALLARLDEAIEEVEAALADRAEIVVEHPLDVLESTVDDVWLPVQKNIALGLSHIRVTGRENFIRPKEAAALVQRLRPGDILLQRRNLYATNLGIPGFWPHAALYVGTPAELEALVLERGGGEGAPANSAARLAELHPEALGRLSGADVGGFPFRVIEAIKPGVVLTSIEMSANADSLAVLRPRLTLEQRLRAVAAAFDHLGKPYDYNFDFATDRELVCSELVCKAYEAVTEDFGFEPITLNGRSLYPPNRFAERFDREAASGGQTLDLVLFLDGSEAAQAVTERGEREFRQSWRRPKWFILTH